MSLLLRRFGYPLVAVACSLWLAMAGALADDNCVPEQEANDVPEQAFAVHDHTCTDGTAGDGDQDLFLWTVSSSEAALPYLLVLEAPAGQGAAIEVLVALMPQGAVAPSGAGRKLLSLQTEGRGLVRSEPLLLDPGNYLIGVSIEGAAGPYRLRIGRATIDRLADRPTDRDSAIELVADTTFGGDRSTGARWFAWHVGDFQARRRWILEVNAPLGAALNFDLQQADGTTLLNASEVMSGPYRLYDLGLDAGTYYFRFPAVSTTPAPFTLRLSADGPRVPTREDEPNDRMERANRIELARPISGRIARWGDVDRYAFDVDATNASRRLEITLANPDRMLRRLCLTTATGAQLQCRDSGEPTIQLVDLVLPAATYGVAVSGTPSLRAVYQLTVRIGGAELQEFAAEPNDTIETAAITPASGAIRGRLVEGDVDVVRLSIDGEPRLWRIIVEGSGVMHLSRLNGRGAELARAHASGEPPDRVVLTEQFLPPGDHWVRLVGSGSEITEYLLYMEEIGLPDPLAEREPNDTPDTAHRLRFGETRIGRLPPGDIDVYRFSPPAAAHVALTVVPPEDGDLEFRLNWGSSMWFQWPGARSRGQPLVYRGWLESNDYIVTLRPYDHTDGSYQIRLDLLDPFDLPADLEPNDSQALARPFPASLTASGTAGQFNDEDWYRLPQLPAETTARIRLEGTSRLKLISDGGELPLREVGHGTLEAVLPATKDVYLALSGFGDYTVEVEFEGGPPAAPQPDPPPIAMSIEFPSPTVAAYWPRGQRMGGILELVNQGDTSLEVSLDAASSHFALLPRIDGDVIHLAAGTQRRVPFEVEVLPDAWEEAYVKITLRARGSDGGQVTTSAIVSTDAQAPAVGEELAFPISPALRGGFNVAATALGSVVQAPPDLAKEQAKLFDGLDATGSYISPRGEIPSEVTVLFGADRVWPIAGFLFYPLAPGYSAAEQLKDFDVLLSEDGTRFEPVLAGSLSTLAVEQPFVLDRPRMARAARLIMRNNHAHTLDRMMLGEWKVVTAPDAALETPLNVADAGRGGHIVWSSPAIGRVGNPAEALQFLTEGGDPAELSVDAGTEAEWVIGFHDNRAAQIDFLEWLEAVSLGTQQSRISGVEVSASIDSPLGPWRVLGQWELREEDGSRHRWDLPGGPQWVRFLRFALHDVPDQATAFALPVTLRAFERPSNETYRSILAEWGHHSQSAIFEALQQYPLAPSHPRAEVAKDEALQLEQPVRGSVQRGVNEDRYVIDIPDRLDVLTLVLRGDPTVTVEAALEDDSGTPVPLRPMATGARELIYEASVVPERKYFVRVEQPPHTIALLYDKSPSLEYSIPAIFRGLDIFAAGVKRGIEHANIMPFEKPFLLEEWSDQAHVLQMALVNDPTASTSSNLEITMVDALKGLDERLGSRAVVVITDAETSSYQMAGEMWRLLDEVRPQVFAAHTGFHSRDPLREKQIMQDLASVRGGHYASARTDAEFNVIFERAAAWLRRPAEYELKATAERAPPPAPGSIEVAGTVPPAQAGAAHESREERQAVLAVAPANVEIVLDASGSMLQRMEGRRRIEIARDILKALVKDNLPAGIPFALRVFGHNTPQSCDTGLLVPLGPLDPVAVARMIDGIYPQNLARTPIADSLREVEHDLHGVEGQRTVVLITDGEETCGGDPGAEIAALVAKGYDVRVNIVGFAVDEPELKDTFREWAAIGRGEYFDANDSHELAAAVEAAVGSAPLRFRVVDVAGGVVAEGQVGGPPVSVATGHYGVEIDTDPPLAFFDVKVREQRRVRLSLDEARTIEASLTTQGED